MSGDWASTTCLSLLVPPTLHTNSADGLEDQAHSQSEANVTRADEAVPVRVSLPIACTASKMNYGLAKLLLY